MPHLQACRDDQIGEREEKTEGGRVTHSPSQIQPKPQAHPNVTGRTLQGGAGVAAMGKSSGGTFTTAGKVPQMTYTNGPVAQRRTDMDAIPW